MIAKVSDGSATDYSETSPNEQRRRETDALGVYTFTYRAASGGQKLTITFTQESPGSGGNVTLQAATLAP